MSLELEALVDTLIARDPGRPAVLAPGRAPLGYGSLGVQLEQTVAGLARAGFGDGGRIAMLLPNGPEAAVATIAVAAHATCVPLNPAYGEDDLRFYLEDSGAGALIVPSADTGPGRRVAASLGLAVIDLSFDPSWPAGRFVLDVSRSATREPPAPGTVRSGRDVALILHTSGTTARPKIVPLSQANLASSARAIARHLALSPGDRGLNVMPLFHIHGLVGSLLASIAAGASLVCTPGFDDERFFEWVAAFEPTWYTAVPTIHQAILARGARYRAVAPAHRFRLVRSSSASLPPQLLGELERLFDAPVIEAYGMTEAAHHMASNPLPPAVRKPGSVGVPAGADIVVLDREGRPVEPGDEGEIAVRGPGVTVGYEANPAANAAAFDDGWLRTGDLGRFDADGYLQIAGRLKEIVNRGGEKISPREVDEALLEHPDVAQAVAFATPHPSLEEDLVAAVVLRPGTPEDEQALRAYLFGRLPDFKVPSQLLFVDAIPKGPTGKVQRTTLHRVFGHRLVRPFEPPADELEQVVAESVQSVLAIAGVGRRDNFFGLGCDSLSGVRIVARVNDQLGLAMAIGDLFRHPTVMSFSARARAAKRLRDDEDARLVAEISALSDEEIERRLAGAGSGGGDLLDDASRGFRKVDRRA